MSKQDEVDILEQARQAIELAQLKKKKEAKHLEKLKYPAFSRKAMALAGTAKGFKQPRQQQSAQKILRATQKSGISVLSQLMPKDLLTLEKLVDKEN